jgi:hypothetical protein
MKTLVTVALGAALLCSTPLHADEAVGGAPAGAFDMDSWETQVLGAIHGTYCGYYPNRVTIVARAIGIKSYNECHNLFAAMAPICVKNLKDANRWHVSSSLEGTKLGTDLGTCIDAGYQRAMKKPR